MAVVAPTAAAASASTATRDADRARTSSAWWASCLVQRSARRAPPCAAPRCRAGMRHMLVHGLRDLQAIAELAARRTPPTRRRSSGTRRRCSRCGRCRSAITCTRPVRSSALLWQGAPLAVRPADAGRHQPRPRVSVVQLLDAYGRAGSRGRADGAGDCPGALGGARHPRRRERHRRRRGQLPEHVRRDGSWQRPRRIRRALRRPSRTRTTRCGKVVQHFNVTAVGTAFLGEGGGIPRDRFGCDADGYDARDAAVDDGARAPLPARAQNRRRW